MTKQKEGFERSKSYDCLKTFFKSLDDMVFVLDEKKRFVLFHAPDKALLFAEPEKFLGVAYSKVLPKDVSSIIDKNWRLTVEGKVVEFEYSAFIRGEERWFSAKMSPATERCIFKGVIAIIRDVTRLKEVERSLERDYAALKKLDEIKSTILRDVSHELKTPISLLTFSGKMIHDEAKKSDPSLKSINKYAEIIQRNSGLLDKHIASILDLSRLRSSVKTMKKDVNLSVIAGDVIKELEPSAKAKGLKVKKKIEKNCHLLANRLQMYSMIRNILENAIKFTKKGTVTVSCVMKQTQICITVKDTGRGIRKIDQKHIFRSFSKFSKDSGGLGVGLAIAKKVVLLHGGDIFVDSRSGKGSLFTVFLPRC